MSFGQLKKHIKSNDLFQVLTSYFHHQFWNFKNLRQSVFFHMILKTHRTFATMIFFSFSDLYVYNVMPISPVLKRSVKRTVEKSRNQTRILLVDSDRPEDGGSIAFLSEIIELVRFHLLVV